MTNPTSVDPLIEQFEAELPQRLRELQMAWQGPQRGTAEALASLQRIAHNLAGSAGALGYPALASAAQQVEKAAQDLIAAQADADSVAQAQLHQSLNALGHCLAHPVRIAQPVRNLSAKPSLAGRNKLIYVVDDDPIFCRLIATELAHFGFDVQGIDRLAALPQIINQAMPDVIVMDILFPEGPRSGPQAIEDIRAQLPASLPIIFISTDGSPMNRIAAVRAGGQAFFTKPFDVTELVDTIDRLLALEQRQPYRVVIVEDATSLAAFYADVLTQAGMIAQVVNYPLEVFDVLERFRPDLILMDIYMPEVNGVELAQAIRQHRSYMGVPIVFLSGERDPTKQLAALGRGGDDFLVKPVEPAELVRAVSIRATRHQALRELMIKDGLTGLLNHTQLLSRFDHELQRAIRSGTPLSFVMIDIDRFKQVNDTWGHAVGDHVILTLARLLRERLRASDIIGRYGGEEFGVIMPDTSQEDARQVIDALRMTFLGMDQYAGKQAFKVTFSAGVAQAREGAADSAVIARADAALYRAKQEGRNRVCLG